MRISDWSSDVCSSDLLRLDIFDVVGQRIFVDRAVIEADAAAFAAPAVEPGDTVLHPVRIVAVREILVRVGAAAFLAVERRVHRHLRQIGRESCGGRVCQYVSIWGVAGELKKKKK